MQGNDWRLLGHSSAVEQDDVLELALNVLVNLGNPLVILISVLKGDEMLGKFRDNKLCATSFYQSSP